MPDRSHSALLERPLRALGRIRRRVAGSPTTQRSLALVSVAALVLAAWLAWENLPTDREDPSLWPLVLSGLLAVPGAVGLNMLEYSRTARLLGVEVDHATSLRVVFYGTAANLLPLPGAALVRLQSLRRNGAPVVRATTALAGVGLLWLSVATAVAGVGLLSQRPATGLAFLAGGLAAAVAAAGLLGRQAADDRPFTVLAELAVIEFGMVLLAGIRLLLVMIALGVDGGMADALVLGLSGSAAAAVGFLPAGLGVREAIGAALGGLVGLGAATGLLVVLIDRVVTSAALVPLAGIFFWWDRGHGGHSMREELARAQAELGADEEPA